MNPDLESEMGHAWASTCRILLGDEIGELGKYENYLKKYVEPVVLRNSEISGNAVALGDDRFCKDAKFISSDEADFISGQSDPKPLSLNEIKDIDSIAAALRERFVYSGNLLLGNCRNIECSHRCSNSFSVKNSQDVSDSKYVAYSYGLRFCESAFGCSFAGEAKFGIKSTQFSQSARCMEVILTMNCSDCYYTANMQACQQCIFSFNQKNRNYLIGNLPLPKEKYLQFKSSLMEQIRNELESKKNVLSIQELLGAMPWGQENGKSTLQTPSSPSLPAPQKEVEASFQSTTAVLFGKRLTGIFAYSKWLSEHVPLPIPAKSSKSGARIFIVPLFAYSSWFSSMVSFDEAWALGKNAITPAQAGTLSLSNAQKSLEIIAYSTSELRMLDNSNVVACANYYSAVNCYHGTYYAAKNSGFSFFAREVENVFGCDKILYSKFCLKCHHSYNLVRCFEVSDSLSCSDCYFCHNVENCQECLFCFNVKSKRYAIGNVEYPKEYYLIIKKLLLSEISSKIEKNKGLGLNIFNICEKAH